MNTRPEIKLNTVAYDEFIVNDVDGNLVTGLVDGNFTKKLYNPSGTEVSGSITVTITELGNGLYRANFTPNALGQWAILITHSTYFAHGKGGSYLCVENLSDDLASDISDLDTKIELIKQIESGRWKIDTNTKEMVFYKDDNVTEIMRFKLYDDEGNLDVQDVFERRRQS